MDDLEALKRAFRRHIGLTLLLQNLIFGLCLYYCISFLNYKLYIDFLIAGTLALIFLVILSYSLSNYIIQPLAYLRQSILHLSPRGTQPIKAPDIKVLSTGHQLVVNLTGQLYEIAKIGHQGAIKDGTISNLSHNFIANSLPLPLLVLNDSQEIKFANNSAASYIGMPVNDLVGKNVYMVLDMAFPSEDTFDSWLKDVMQKTAIATKSWERVKLSVRDNHPALLFDLAAYYNKGNSDGNSTLMVLFDHTKQYSQDDQAVSFVALTVHELRTPLTLLKGYIEVFEQEFKGKTTAELDDFLDKLQAASDQLTAFVNNILNVARVDSDQLEFRLQPEDWQNILTKTVESLKLRANVRGIDLQLTIAPNLPEVAVDNISIQEVVNNLVDNAVKYSGTSKVIKINSLLNSEGRVETTVEDFGVGIPSGIMPNLFTKFYRDHRNRAQIGGAGLGLYLSKAIVNAHGGNLWVKSHEGKGSTFGFTLVTYAQLSKDQKIDSNDSNKLVRSAHGWIKNHSYYRR